MESRRGECVNNCIDCANPLMDGFVSMFVRGFGIGHLLFELKVLPFHFPFD